VVIRQLFNILDHNFWTRNARKSIKDADSGLVSNDNFSEILLAYWLDPRPGNMSQMAQKLLHYDVTHKKTQPPIK